MFIYFDSHGILKLNFGLEDLDYNDFSESESYTYSFSDPDSYRGPIVNGWPPERSRDVKKYIRPNENTVVSGKGSL